MQAETIKWIDNIEQSKKSAILLYFYLLFLKGNEITKVYCYVFILLGAYISEGFTWVRRPNFLDHLARLLSRPAIRSGKMLVYSKKSCANLIVLVNDDELILGTSMLTFEVLMQYYNFCLLLDLKTPPKYYIFTCISLVNFRNNVYLVKEGYSYTAPLADIFLLNGCFYTFVWNPPSTLLQ